MSVQTLDFTRLGMGEFPERLYVCKMVNQERYLCFCLDGVHGLQAFEHEASASRMAALFKEGTSFVVGVLEVSFDEARLIAKARPPQVTSLILLDAEPEPLVHYVR